MAFTYTDSDKVVMEAVDKFRVTLLEAVEPGDMLSWYNSDADYTVQFAAESDSQKADCIAMEKGAAGATIWATKRAELKTISTIATGGVVTRVYFAGEDDYLGAPLYLGAAGKPSSTQGTTMSQMVGHLVARDRILLDCALDPTPSTTNIWVSTEGKSDGTGSREHPYALPSQAMAVVTAARKKIILMPGTYTEAAALAWSTTITDVLMTGISADAESTIITQSAGDEVITIKPAASVKASNFLCFMAHLTIEHPDGDDGVVIDNALWTDGTAKLIVTFRDCIFLGEDDDKSIYVKHATSTTSSIKVYMHGRGIGGNNVEGIVYLDFQNGADRFKANGMNFESHVQITTTGAVAAQAEYAGCIFNRGSDNSDQAVGGNASHEVRAVGCYGRGTPGDELTYTACAKGDCCETGNWAAVNGTAETD